MVFHGTPVDLLDGSGRLWSFAGREFDEARLELRVEGKPAELELKPLEVLVQLLQRAGEVVTKEELLESVWPGLTVVDGSLSTAIYKLRRAIRDEDSSVIVTVPRVGYRLAVAVHSQSTRSTPTSTREGFIAGNPVPGREHWSLVRSLDISQTSEVWLAEHPQTGDYIHLDDPGSDWARPHLIELYLHQGKEREAEAVPPTHIPQWTSFTMLQACAAHRPSTEITALASHVRGEQDPEVDYFFASHLSYCGQTAAAVQLLKRAIQGNYCSYPAIDSDSFFAKIRTEPEFPEIRSAAIACQQNFLAAR